MASSSGDASSSSSGGRSSSSSGSSSGNTSSSSSGAHSSSGASSSSGAGSSSSGASSSGTASSSGGRSSSGSSSGSSSSGSSGGSSSSAGSSGSGSSSSSGAGDGGAGDYTCSLVIGESPTGQWFDGGFLTAVDSTKWECIWVAHTYTNDWANASATAWSTGFDPYTGTPHTCATNSQTPDRVIFVAAQWSETTAAQWETDLTGVINNINTKFKNPKRIDLMALTSGPTNSPCPVTAGAANETIIPAEGYTALDAMPAKFPGQVFSLPHFAVPTCSDFNVTNGSTQPTYTTAGAQDVGVNVFAAYFNANQ